MKLYKHQQELRDKNPDKWLLAWEVGTGKTLGALSLLKNKALVIVPKSLKEQWEKEPFEIDVITKETFRRDHKGLPAYRAIIIDEAHNFSGMQGFRKKSGMLKAILEYIKKNNPEQIYLLTGTPYLSTPWNIYALAEILGFKWDYMKYKNLFFDQVNMGRRFPVPVIKKNVKWTPGKNISIESAIAKLVNRLGNTVKMADCVDVPEQIFQVEYFDLTKEQKDSIEQIEDINPIVRWTLIHQICGGTLKGDGYRNGQTFKSEKMKRAAEMAEEHKKIIFVFRYNYEIEVLKQKIKRADIFIINGKTKDRHSVVTKAEKADSAVVLVQAQCSEGYELPSFPLMVFYSYSFSLKDYIQMKGRIQRLNAIKKNVYLSLVVKDSIDEDVYKCIQNKSDFDIEIYDKR